MMSHLKWQFHGIRGIIDQIERNLRFAQNSGTLIKRESREPQEVRSFINERSISSGGKLLLHAAIHNRPWLARNSDPAAGFRRPWGPSGKQNDKWWSAVPQFIKQWEGKKLSLLWRSRMVLITSLAKWSTICWPGTQILLCFVSMTNSAIFACLVLTKNQKMWWYNLFLKMNFEGCTFKQWKKQGQFTAWPGMTLCRCVFVPSSEEGSSGYVWAVLKHYQHDWEAVQTIIRELLDETMTWPTVHHLESVFCLNSHTSGHSHLFLFGLYGDECMGNGTMRIEIHQSQPTTVI